jgi:hypothetical protein
VRISFFGIDSFQIAAIVRWPLVTRLLGEPLLYSGRYNWSSRRIQETYTANGRLTDWFIDNW